MKKYINGVKTLLRQAEANLKYGKKEKIDKNIHGVETIGELYSFQKRILGYLKYAFIAPLIDLGKVIAGKHLVREVPDIYMYRNIKIFDDAFDKALVSWVDTYCYGFEHKNPLKFVNDWLIGGAANLLRNGKDLIKTVIMSDSAYTEFFNNLMFRITEQMYEVYKGVHDHVIYKSKAINDARFFVLTGTANETVLMERIHQVKLNNGTKKIALNKNEMVEIANQLGCNPDKISIMKSIEALQLDGMHYRQVLLKADEFIKSNYIPRR